MASHPDGEPHPDDEPRAVLLARELVSQHAGRALSRATERRHMAVVAGHTGRADLYLAVCTILADPDLVFSGMRRPEILSRAG